MVTCLESVQKNKVVLRKLAVSGVSKKSTLAKEVKKTILDDDFWNVNEVVVNLLKPLSSAITELEADVPSSAEVYKLYSNVGCDIRDNLQSVPFSLQEQEKIATIFAEREEFCIKIILKAAYFLDPREHGMLLCDEEKVAAIEFLCGLAKTFSSFELLTVDSSKVHQDCVPYSAKDGFYALPFLWKNIANISPVSWWNRYCTNQELSKIADRLLKLPSTTAAVERSFSCYSNIYTAKRNRLTIDKASKLVFVFQNIQRTTGQQSKHSSQAA